MRSRPQLRHACAPDPGDGTLIGYTYLERGVPVVVLARWGTGGGPRNVLVRRADGSRVVRPFRGLRRVSTA
jgi:acetyl esterase